MRADPSISMRVMLHTTNSSVQSDEVPVEDRVRTRLYLQSSASTDLRLHQKVNAFVREHKLDDLADSTLRMQEEQVVARVLRWGLPHATDEPTREARQGWASRMVMLLIKAARRGDPRPKIVDPPGAWQGVRVKQSDAAPSRSRAPPPTSRQSAPEPRAAPTSPPPSRPPARRPEPRAAPTPRRAPTRAAPTPTQFPTDALDEDVFAAPPTESAPRRLDPTDGLRKTMAEFIALHGEELALTLWENVDCGDVL
eukprot:TRINITY_DN5182_c0_g1_i1.p3 TRINITY_DN5182_c0_g1~~TRINITY_DN5182_c0_g1_i1.p3  ORF type:complete len:253 (+),score=53.13 TRINITY_DN5182_c0_g1_i1:368-1126(+)